MKQRVRIDLENRAFYFIQWNLGKHLVAGIHDALHAHEPGAAHAHVLEAPVLSGPQVHHLASVMGLLVHQPVAVHHLAGHAVGHAVTVLDVVAVLAQLIALTAEVLPLEDLHLVGSTVLQKPENQRIRQPFNDKSNNVQRTKAYRRDSTTGPDAV